MVNKRAFFTPSPESVPRLAAQALFSDATDRPKVTFQVDMSLDPEVDLPALAEVTINPVERIIVSGQGFELQGRRLGAANVIGRLSVDMTTEPYIATYSETTPDTELG